MSRTSVNDPGARYYENEMPNIGEVVYVKVTQVNETSAYAHLLEYRNMEGMIPYTELTRLRIRSIHKFIKVGKCQAAQVIRLDKDKGYIDLSKKQVTREEGRTCEEKFNKSKVVHSVMRHAASETGVPLLKIMETVAWPLYRTYPHAFDALKTAVTDPDVIFSKLEGVSEEVKNSICKTIQHRLKTQPSKIRADINVTCFAEAGIDAIREVLQLGQAEGMKGELQMPIEVIIVAPPQYIVRTQTDQKEEGLKKLIEVVEMMKNEMARRGGTIEVVEPPRVVGDDGEDQKPQDQDDEESEEDE